MSSELVTESLETTGQSQLGDDLTDLYISFGGTETPNEKTLLDFAGSTLDFRAGRPREDTPWSDGGSLTPSQKQATLDVATRWGMLQTTEPHNPYDQLVILGAHRDSLTLRTRHAVELAQQRRDGIANFIVLSCFRPIHPKEGIDQTEIDNEQELAVSLLQDNIGAKFETETVSSWDDQPDDTERATGEYGIAYMGKIGLHHATIISGSVPSSNVRATTVSTLESLRTHLEDSRPRLLFVTTSLHLPYQAIQVKRVMQGFESEVAGIAYDWLAKLTIESEDADFRVVLQEIGATIKNSLANT